MTLLDEYSGMLQDKKLYPENQTQIIENIPKPVTDEKQSSTQQQMDSLGITPEKQESIQQTGVEDTIVGEKGQDTIIGGETSRAGTVDSIIKKNQGTFFEALNRLSRGTGPAVAQPTIESERKRKEEEGKQIDRDRIPDVPPYDETDSSGIIDFFDKVLPLREKRRYLARNIESLSYAPQAVTEAGMNIASFIIDVGLKIPELPNWLHVGIRSEGDISKTTEQVFEAAEELKKQNISANDGPIPSLLLSAFETTFGLSYLWKDPSEIPPQRNSSMKQDPQVPNSLLEAFKGPNIFWEFYYQMFKDSQYQIEGLRDVSYLNKHFIPSILASQASEGLEAAANSDFGSAILEFFRVPAEEETPLLRGLTFGTEVGMIGPTRMYTLGTRRLIDGTTQYLYPNLEKGSKIFKIGNTRKIAQARLNTLKETHGKGPWAKKTPTLNEILETQGHMAWGAGSTYAAADMFLENTDYQDASLLFGLVGMMTGGDWGKLGKIALVPTPNRLVRSANRTLNFLLYRLLTTADKAEKGLLAMTGKRQEVHSVSFERAHVNSYLRAMGYKGKEIKKIEESARRNVQALIDEYGREEGIRKAKELRYMREDGTIDINIGKQPYTEVSANDLKLWREVIDELENIKDPKLKTELKVAAERTQSLFSKLERDMKDLPEGVYDQIQMTLAQALQLHTIKSYQSALLSKVHLNSFGFFKKGEIIGQMERVQRIMDTQVDAIRTQLTKLIPKTDADEVTTAIFKRINASVNTEISNREKIYNQLKALREKFKLKIETENNAYMRNSTELMRIGLDEPLKINEKRFHVYNIFHGKRMRDKDTGVEGDWEDYPYKDMGATPQQKVTRKGILPSRIEESSRRYETLFETAEKNDYFIDIGKLEDTTFAMFRDDMFLYKIREVVGNKVPSISDFTIISAARRRGLDRKRKEFDDAEDYFMFLEDTVADIPNIKAPKFTQDDYENVPQMIQKLENALLNHKEKIDDIPTLLSVREWHALRSKALKEERRLYNANDMQRYNSLKFARKNLEDTFQRINDETFAVRDAEGVIKRKADGTPVFTKEGKKIFDELKEQFKNANDYHRDYVAIFNQGRLLEMLSQSRGRHPKYLPEEYMSVFFTGRDNLAFGRRQFDNLFAKRDAKGEIVTANGNIVHTEEGVELLLDGLGFAISKGSITTNVREIIESYSDIIGKERTEFFIKLDLERQNRIFTNLQMTPKDKQFVEGLNNKLTEILDSDIDEASRLAIQRVQQSIGAMSTLKNTELPSFAQKYWTNTAEAANDERIAKALFDNALAPMFAIPLKQREKLIKEGKDVTKENWRQYADPQDRKDIFENMDEILPPSVAGDAQAHPLDVLLEYTQKTSSPEKYKEFVDNLRSVLMRDLLRKSIVGTKDISIRNTGQRKLLRRSTMDAYDAETLLQGQFSLSKEFDVIAMEQFFIDRAAIFKRLYKDDRKHLENIGELFDLAKLTKSSKDLLNIQGIASPYSMQMGIGRLYNVMKGVLSPRYLALEAGAIQVRVKTQQALTEMFLSPTAAQVIVDGFVRFEKPFQAKILTATLGKMLGLDLSKEEESKIIKAAIESRNYVQRVMQPHTIPPPHLDQPVPSNVKKALPTNLKQLLDKNPAQPSFNRSTPVRRPNLHDLLREGK